MNYTVSHVDLSVSFESLDDAFNYYCSLVDYRWVKITDSDDNIILFVIKT